MKIDDTRTPFERALDEADVKIEVNFVGRAMGVHSSVTGTDEEHMRALLLVAAALAANAGVGSDTFASLAHSFARRMADAHDIAAVWKLTAN